MKLQNLFLGIYCTTFFLSAAVASNCVATKSFANLKKVEASWGTCVLADNKVECFNSKNNAGSVTPPQMTRPIELASNAGGYCALADEGVKCWGRLSNKVPKLSNPKNISVQRGAACAHTDDGIKCWNHKGEINLSPLAKGASEVVLGGDWDTNYLEPQFGCALLTNGSVDCWGDNYYGQASPPKLANPSHLVAGESHICALTDQGVKCWGSWEQYGQTIVPMLNKVTQIDVGDDYTYCALENNGNSSCWGALDYLKLPSKLDQISVGHQLVCGKSGNSVTCTGVGYDENDTGSCPIF